MEEKLGLKELISMGVGGMVGGGIFSVLGLSVSLSGNAAPIAFLVGGVVAFLTGISYFKLGLAFKSDGGSFTYLEHSFKNKNLAGIGGWLLLAGYIGTLTLYSYTFGVYGAAMAGAANWLRHLFETLIILIFLIINLIGVKIAGEAEDIIVLIKVLILMFFTVVGIIHLETGRLFPVLSKGANGLFMGAALIFVAYEGFELIPNAINETVDPEKNLKKGIMYSIIITTLIYVLVAIVAVANLTPVEIQKYKEYALAVAAKPFLGSLGFILIGIGALLSTSSAINATLFGTARLSMVMAKEEELPKAFSLKEKTKDIPWAALVIISIITLIFVNTADLTIISSFSSSTFLLIFLAINLSALKLHKEINVKFWIPLLSSFVTLGIWITLLVYLYKNNSRSFYAIGIFYLAVIIAELFFSERRIIKKYL